MRLIRLTANHASFKTVEFNRDGLTLIIGVKTSDEGKEKSKRDKTYNGVGKSLLIELLHFCLGTQKNEALENAIPHWEFSLNFEINGIEHTVTRNTSSQNKVFLDNQELSLNKYKDLIEARVFHIPPDIPGLTFRPLISKFIRPTSKSYVVPDATSSDYAPYEALIRNAFLLGLDTELISEKSKLRREFVDTEALIKSFEKDPVINEFFRGGQDVDITIRDSQEEISRLEEELKRFEVAANYYEIQQEADALSNKVFDIKNQIVLLRNAISSIDASLKQRPDISRERVVRLYGEVRVAFQPETIKYLKDVETFHATLLENRIARLSKDRLQFQKELSSLEQEITSGQKELDKKLALLGSSRALDQFVAITKQIAELKAQSQKLKDYKELKQIYSDNLARISTKLSTAIIKTNAYLADYEADIEKKLSPFRSFSKRFYPKAPAGITLKNNEGDNQLRFDLDVRIQNDASDGVNEVRIYCFDMTLLLARHMHTVNFVIHDSRLFSDIDPRQRAILFKTASEVCKSHGFQYIATVNQDQIESMAGEFSPDELKRIIYDNVKLELKDDSPESKLLGIQVDLHY